MLAQILTLKLGSESFKLRWDMHAIAVFERLTGGNGLVGVEVTVGNLAAVLWAAIDSYAASRDEDAPVSYRRFATLVDTDEKMQHAVEIAAQLLQLNAPDEAAKKPAGKGGRAAAKRSRSGAATKSGP